MKYLVSVIDDGQAHAAGSDYSSTPAEDAAIDEFNASLVSNGHWVFAGGLSSPEASKVIDNRAGAGTVTDGPLVEGNPYIAGFWIVEVADHAEALRLATAGSEACNRRVEVRAILLP